MNNTQSIYLDLIRFLASLAVLFAHLPHFIGGYLWQLGQFSHQAVILFFVLSGFVIAFVVDQKENSFNEYILNRTIRIYSVALPALIISVVVYYLASHFNPEVIEAFERKMLNPYLTFIHAIFFTNQAWISYNIFANPPYWSLGYEVLYYIFFGVIYFLKGYKRYLFGLVLILLMGPSVLLYLPIWLIGVLTYKLNQKKYIQNELIARIIFFFSSITILLLMLPNMKEFFLNITTSYFPKIFLSYLNWPANQFLSDYILAIILLLHIVSIRKLNSNLFHRLMNKYKTLIREGAKYTFSIYLFHFPLLCFFAIFFPYENSPLISMILSTFALAISIVMLSNITEGQRHKVRIYFSNKWLK